MPHNIDLFDTYYMAGMVQEIMLPTTFFRDRYFPTGAGDIFAANKVLVEYQDGDRRLAPFVVPRAGDIPVGRGGYEVHEFEAPSILPSRLLTMDDLQRRGFGEALFSGSTQAERARALHMRDLTDLDMRITRREEWMSAQTMINNGCTMTAYIDNTTVGQTYDVFFYDTSGSNPAIYTVADKWGEAGSNFFGDVAAMCETLADRGLPVTELLVGTDVADFILTEAGKKDSEMGVRLDNRRMEFGHIAPSIQSPGVTWLGRLNFSGFELDILSIRETYTDDKGMTQRFFPAKSAMVTAPNCGHMMYAQISQIEEDNQYHTFAMRRVPKFVVDRDKDTRKLRLGARPLAAPLQNSPWMYAANVVK